MRMTAIDFSRSVVGLSDYLKPYAMNLTKDLEDARDLLQETMYKALRNQDKYREGTNLKAWMFTIMKNIFINNYRKKNKQQTIFDQTDNQYYINSTNNIIFNRAESNFVMEDINQAISELSDDFRVPFMMHFRGYKYQEIADEMQLPLGTVKSRIFFARRELRKKLELYKYSRSLN